jgi:hypothetical protein
MKLNEMFEAFRPIRANFGTDEDVSNGKFTTMNLGMIVHYTFVDHGKNRYMVVFTDVGNGVYDVGFSANPVSEGSVEIDDYLHMKATTAFQAMKVFGIVGYIMEQFVNQFNVKALRFAGSEDDHDKAYKLLARSPAVKKFSDKTGFEYDGIHDVKLLGMDKKYHMFKKKGTM